MVNPAQDWPDFTRAMLLVGVDTSGNPIGVLVDDDGNLSAVLKGAGPTGLTTIGVDANGRIEVFLLDAQSQWGDVLRIGNAELAVRLGSSKSWDWRGNEIYYNDFRQGTGNILKYNNGTGSSIALDPALWVNGGFALKMTGGSDGDGDAYLDVLIDHPPSKQIGLEAHFSGNPTFDYVYLRLEYRIAGTGWYAGLRLKVDGVPDVAYLNSSGAWVDIGVSYPGTAAEAFNHFKIVADFDTGKYVRAMWGKTEYDLSAQALQSTYLGNLDQITARFYVKSTSGENEYRYLDYLRVTVDEPL